MSTDARRFLSKRIGVVGHELAFYYLDRATCHQRKTGRPVIYMTLGQPDFDPHEEIVRQCVDSLLKKREHGYTLSRGMSVLLEAVAGYMLRTRRIDVSPDSIIVGMGSKMVTTLLIMAIVNPGDEVLYQEPGYQYVSPIRLCDGVPVAVPIREEKGFMIDPDELRSLITDRAKLLILNYPSNPTGGVADRHNLEQIFAIAEEYDLFIISDEVYSQLVYDQPFVSIATLPGALDRTALIESGSKGHAMAGWRIGCAVVPQALVDPYTCLFESYGTCLPPFIQRGAAKAFSDPHGTYADWMAERAAQYVIRREVLLDGISKISGLTCHKPGGAFYGFVNVKQAGLSSEDFALRLLQKNDVAVLPGTAFGQRGEGFIRLSFASSLENIEEALRRIQVFVTSL